MLFKSTAPEWVTNHLCPALGLLLNNILWCLPFTSVQAAREKMSLGPMNTIPFLAMIFNNSAWSIYGLVKKDYYIFFSAIPGVILGTYYSVTSIIIMASNKDIMNAERHLQAIIFIAFFWSCIGFIVGIVLTTNSDERYSAALLVGIISDFGTVSYFSAPLSTLLKVVRTHDSSSLNLPTIILNSVDNLMWSVYGILGLNNPLVWVPNVIGLLLGGLQLFVFFTYHAKAVVVHISTKISQNMSRKYGGQGERQEGTFEGVSPTGLQDDSINLYVHIQSEKETIDASANSPETTV